MVVAPTVHVGSPRLVNSHDAADFAKEVIQESPDAGL